MIGIPYGEAGVTPDGRATATCPVCGLVFVGPDTDSEDAATKGATFLYGTHYEAEHAHPPRPSKAYPCAVYGCSQPGEWVETRTVQANGAAPSLGFYGACSFHGPKEGARIEAACIGYFGYLVWGIAEPEWRDRERQGFRRALEAADRETTPKDD